MSAVFNCHFNAEKIDTKVLYREGQAYIYLNVLVMFDIDLMVLDSFGRVISFTVNLMFVMQARKSTVCISDGLIKAYQFSFSLRSSLRSLLLLFFGSCL